MAPIHGFRKQQAVGSSPTTGSLAHPASFPHSRRSLPSLPTSAVSRLTGDLTGDRRFDPSEYAHSTNHQGRLFAERLAHRLGAIRIAPRPRMAVRYATTSGVGRSSATSSDWAISAGWSCAMSVMHSTTLASSNLALSSSCFGKAYELTWSTSQCTHRLSAREY